MLLRALDRGGQVHPAFAQVMVGQLGSGGLGTVPVFVAYLRAFGRPCSDPRSAEPEKRRIGLRSFAPAWALGSGKCSLHLLGAPDSFRKPLRMSDPGTIEVLCSWRKGVNPDF